MPFPYKKILCPIDLDENSIDALKEAAALARVANSPVHLLHVVQINPLAAQGAFEGLSGGEMYQTQVEFARQRLKEIAQAHLTNVPYEITIEIGMPTGTILEQIDKTRADLVVMATHGRRGVKHLILGSVAEMVVRESPVPVLTIRPPTN
jgi:nucleotide-binding universal stress UspA family protein